MAKTNLWIELSDWQILVIEKAVDCFPKPDPAGIEALRTLLRSAKRIKISSES
jgi:hypothetical protein